jgi:hypothetical protein
MLGGFRYFSFTDQMIFGSAATGTSFGQNGGTTEAFLYTKTTNTLLGAQIGARLSYFLTPRFALFAVPKMGLFNNHMTQSTSLYTGDGIYNFNLNASSNGLAVLHHPAACSVRCLPHRRRLGRGPGRQRDPALPQRLPGHANRSA